MNAVSKTAMAGLVFGLLASNSFGQNTASKPRSKEDAAGWASFGKLLERAMKKDDEAVDLGRKKHFAAAEATCQEAMDMLQPAPFAQGPVKETLGQIYIEEGLYEEAYNILKPMYHPEGVPTELGCMLIIADCHTSRLAQAMDVIKMLHRKDPQHMVWFADDASLPISSGITYNSVEATAYLIWGGCQPGSAKHPDGIERFETAIRLAPKCGATYYALAWWRSYLFAPNALRVSDDVAALYRKAWQLGDPFLRKQHFPIQVPPQ